MFNNDNVDSILQIVNSSRSYPYDIPHGFEVASTLLTTMEEGGHITLDMDCDFDGFMSTIIFTDILDYVGYSKYSVVRLDLKRHGVDGNTLETVLLNDSKLLIVTDSSSDRVEYLNDLCMRKPDLKIILIDHHKPSKLQRHPNIIEINHHIVDTGYADLSCGLLVFLTMRPMLDNLSNKLMRELESLAYASVISDAIPIACTNLIRFMTVAKSNTSDIHPLLTTMLSMSMKTTLSRDAIAFFVAPKINACFRANRLDTLYDLVFTKSYRSKLYSGTVKPLYQIHRDAGEVTNTLLTNSATEQVTPFIVCNITEAARSMNIDTMEAKNYTGLIAQKITSQYKEPAVCFIEQGDKLKGSFRDYFGRDMLAMVKTYLKADGHNPAFGFVDTKANWSKFLKSANKLSKYLQTEKENKTVLFDSSSLTETEFGLFVDNASKVNELGECVPNIHTSLRLPFNTKISSFKRVSEAKYYGRRLLSYNETIYPSVRLIWKPTDGELVR